MLFSILKALISAIEDVTDCGILPHRPIPENTIATPHILEILQAESRGPHTGCDAMRGEPSFWGSAGGSGCGDSPHPPIGPGHGRLADNVTVPRCQLLEASEVQIRCDGEVKETREVSPGTTEIRAGPTFANPGEYVIEMVTEGVSLRRRSAFNNKPTLNFLRSMPVRRGM